MKEVKKILNDINDNIENYYVGFGGCLYQDLTKEELFLIKNYVINLQQENKRLKNLFYEIKNIVYANISNIDARIFIQDILDKLNI